MVTCPHCKTKGMFEIEEGIAHCLLCGRDSEIKGEVELTTKKDSWSELKDDAVGVIRKFFKSAGETDGDTLHKVKVATSVLSSYTRHEQTESAKEQTAVIVGREIAANKEEFAEYLRISIPRLNQGNLLATGKS